MNKKGFTLIELLAVIIILGILMIIAIPSVTKYINDSRKNAYVDSAKEIISGARNLVNGGKLEMFDTDTTYYINQECIQTENASKSPYGEFTKAYIVVTYNGKGYDYYWTSVDDAGQGISKITKLDNLDVDKIESDLTDNDIPDSFGIDGRSKYMIIDKEQTNCGKGVATTVSDIVSGKTGESPVVYPEGKNKQTSDIGSIVRIGNEEFYIIKREGNDLYLLSRYNLNVGNWPYPNDPVGLQSQYSVGYSSDEYHYGMTHFSSTAYWDQSFSYVFNENSNIYRFVINYKKILEEDYGAYIKEARLLTREEGMDLYNGGYLDSFTKTFFWTGTSQVGTEVYTLHGAFSYSDRCDNMYFTGVRPVIVI